MELEEKGEVTLKRYRGYLIDLDGTVYRGNEAIEEAKQFVEQLRKRNLPYLFVTNNSSRTPQQFAEKLRGMGVYAEPHHVFTSSEATAKYIRKNKLGKSVYMVGEVGLKTALEKEGLTLVEADAELVVMGIDRQINYEKLVSACLQVRNGAIFIATNGDRALPSERGFVPGNGSLVSVVSTSTGVAPTFIGKPEAHMLEEAMKLLGTTKAETIMIGDNYDTDILAGINSGIDTALVYSGVTTKEQLLKKKRKPTYELASLSEWTFT